MYQNLSSLNKCCNYYPKIKVYILLIIHRKSFFFLIIANHLSNIENCQHHLPHPRTLRCEGMRQVAEIAEARRGGVLLVVGWRRWVPLAPWRSQA